MTLNKTIAILAGITAISAASADQYTNAVDPDIPTIGNLAANYNEQAPKVSAAALKGAVEFIAQNEESVKSGKISATEYAAQTAQKLLTPDDLTIELLPTKLSQACLTVYGADLMQQASTSIKDVTKLEASMRELARQIGGAENPNMAHNLTSNLGEHLVMHDIASNLTNGQLQVAEACFDTIGVLNNGTKSKGLKLVQQKGAEGLDLIQNYKAPFDFGDDEVSYLIENAPSLQQKGIEKMGKEERNKVLKDYVLRENGSERAQKYLGAYQKDATMKVSAPARGSTPAKGPAQTILPKGNGR